MDIIVSTVTGLCLRLFLGNLSEALGQVTLVLLGLWEGAVLHHLSNSKTVSNSDAYLAYALRILVDLVLTANIHRLFIILAWTGVGLVVAEIFSPVRRPETKRVRRRTSRSVPAHVRVYNLPTNPVPASSTPRVNHQTSQNVPPTLDISQQLSSPLSILERNSEPGSSSPKFIPNYLPSALANVSSDSPPPQQIHPTPPPPPPPPRAVPDEARETDSARHLPPISEVTEDSDSKHDQFSPSQSQVGLSKPLTSFPPPAATAPHSGPNPTGPPNQPDVPDDEDDLYFPLPVPMSVTNVSNHFAGSARRPETPSEPDDPDSLSTPGVAHREVNPMDELRTPAEPIKVLSPLALGNDALSNFSSPKAPSTARSIHLASSTAPPTFSALGLTSDAAAGSSRPVNATSNSKLPVEYPSAKGSAQDPDTDKFSEAGSDLQTETDATSVISIQNSAQLYAVAEIIRSQAKDKEADRVRLKQELALAESEGRVRDVLFLREEVRISEIEARKLHEKAVRRFIKARNSTKKPETVDVHGLRVAEAIQITEKALRHAFANNLPYVKVIVGKGLHSQGGVPVLKQAVMKTMEGLNIPCKADPNNAGVLILTIP